MKPIMKFVTFGAVLAATAAYAHDGVKNAAVKARMMTMSTIGDNMKMLGGMAKGSVPFDEARAEAAAVAIKDGAARVPALFEAEETDPKSEARPDIWMMFDEFTSKADALEKAAATVDASSLDGVKVGLGNMGGTCKSCHEQFRQEK